MWERSCCLPYLLNVVASNAFASQVQPSLGLVSLVLYPSSSMVLCFGLFSGSPDPDDFFPMGETRRLGRLEELPEPL